MRPVVLAAFLLPFLLHAQGTPKALLWRIQGPGVARPSYLAGTMHSRDARAFTHAGPMLTAIDSCDVVAGELDLSALRSDAERLRTRILLPAGTDLDDLLPKRKFKQVDAALQKELGAMKGLFRRFRPIYLAMMLTEKAQSADSALVLDQYLQEQARERGREVIGIESADEQLAALDALPLKDQADMLYEAVRNGNGPKGTDPLLQAYLDQDLDRLLVLTKDEDRAGQLLERVLIDERNRVMAQRMVDLLAGGRTYLFAVGAAHLPGTAGLIALLQEKGYRLDPVAQ